MTLNEDYMDESDAERDVPFIDYHLVKKFTAKLPKIGSRGRRIRDGDGGANPSKSGQLYLSPLTALSPDTAEVNGNFQKFNVRSDTGVPESKQQYYRCPETYIKEKFNISPSRDSQDSIDSSELRKKKKPLFQRMLERARQEDILKGHKVEKPLYLRLLDNIRPDSDHDDRKKSESYMDENRTPNVRSRIKLPKICNIEKNSPAKPDKPEPERSPKGMRSTDKPFQTTLDLEKEMISSKGPSGHSKAIVDSMRDTSQRKISSMHGPQGMGMENSRSIESLDGYQKRKVTKKPLFQRLLERAQADEERAMRKKIDQYNIRKVMKKKSSAPSKEEIKERIDQGLARNDMSFHLLRKDLDDKEKEKEKEKERSERDKERESIRIRKRQRAMSVQSVPKTFTSTTNHTSNSPSKLQHQQHQLQHYQNQTELTADLPKSRRNRSNRLKKSQTGVCLDDDDDEGYGGDTGGNDACVVHMVRSKSSVVKKGQLKGVEKIIQYPIDTVESAEVDVYVSEAESKHMADMMSELHDEHERDSIIDNAVPIVSYDSPSSINLSEDFGRRDSCVPDDIDALFPSSSIVSNDSDTFMRKLKELNDVPKDPPERWSPLPPRSRNRNIERDKSSDRNDDRDRDTIRDRNSDKERNSDRERDRERDHGRDRDRERDQSRDRSNDRDRDQSRERHSDRDYGRDRNSDRSRDRSNQRGRRDDWDHGRDNSRDRDNGRDRDNSRDRDNGRYRDNGRDRDRDNGKGRDRDQSRDRDSDRIGPTIIQERNSDALNHITCSEAIDIEAINTGRRLMKHDCNDVREDKNNSIRHLNSRTLSGYAPKNIKTSTHSNQGFGLMGPQWVAETLESDENEMGLVLMYSEGFAIFMAEEGTVSGSFSRNTNTPPFPI